MSGEHWPLVIIFWYFFFIVSFPVFPGHRTLFLRSVAAAILLVGRNYGEGIGDNSSVWPGWLATPRPFINV